MMAPSYSHYECSGQANASERTSFGPYCLLSLFQPNGDLSRYFYRWWDTTLGYVSVVGYTGCSVVLFGGMLSLLPSMLVSKYVLKWPSLINNNNNANEKNNKNVLSTMPSLTAIKTLSARSQMSLQGSGGPDYLAPNLIGCISLLGPNIPGSRLFTELFLFSQRLHFYFTGRIFADQMAYLGRKKLGIPFGETAFLHARTCWLDDCVQRFIGENCNNKNQAANVVILGAGFDSRCYRFQQKKTQHAGGTVHWFEMDAPGPQAAKLEALQKAGISTTGVTFVACDFEFQDWLEELMKKNFDKTLPTFFVWEGVTPYLERRVVTQTIEHVTQCGQGSMLGFDYFDKALLDQAMVKAAAKATSERWKFALEDDTDVIDLVRECNATTKRRPDGRMELMILDHLKADELVQRYCAKHSDGRCIGFLEDFGGFLLIGTSSDLKAKVGMEE